MERFSRKKVLIMEEIQRRSQNGTITNNEEPIVKINAKVPKEEFQR